MKQKKGGIIKIIIPLIVILIILGTILGDKDKSDTSDTKISDSKEAEQNNALDKVSGDTAKSHEKSPKEYTSYDIQSLIDDINSNALNASDTYKGKNIEITGGYLDNIDSSGQYITINAGENDFSLTNIQCYIKDDSQLEVIKSINKGDGITIKGTCTDVGEFLGYSINIDEIITE